MINRLINRFAVGRYACVLDDDVWSSIGPFLNGTVSSPVIHSAATADRYIMALYWVRAKHLFVSMPKNSDSTDV